MTPTRISLILILSLALPAFSWNANLPTDPNVVALWNFDGDAAFGLDETANNNDFVRSASVVAASATAQEGSSSADFEYTGGSQFLLRWDADLPVVFPAKNGTTNPCFTVTAWFKLESLSDHYRFATKVSSWILGRNHTSNKLQVYWYGGAGTAVNPDRTLSAGVWYHAAAYWDDPNDSCYAQLYDSSNSHTYTASAAPASAMTVGTGAFCIGGGLGSTTADTDGLLDDVCIWNRRLSVADMNSVRAGTYDFGADPNLVARYRMESTDGWALGLDSGSNNLHTCPTSTSAADTTTYAQGTSSAYFVATDNRIAIPQADLSGNFWLNGGNTTFSLCMWVRLRTTAADHIMGMGGVDVSTAEVLIQQDLGIISVGFANATGTVIVDSISHSTAISANQWYHWAVTYDDSTNAYTFRIYDPNTATVIDTSSGTNDITFNVSETGGNAGWWVGLMTGRDYNDYSGWLDEVVIFDRVLTVGEIDAIRDGTYGESPSGPTAHPELIVITEE